MYVFAIYAYSVRFYNQISNISAFSIASKSASTSIISLWGAFCSVISFFPFSSSIFLIILETLIPYWRICSSKLSVKYATKFNQPKSTPAIIWNPMPLRFTSIAEESDVLARIKRIFQYLSPQIRHQFLTKEELTCYNQRFEADQASFSCNRVYLSEKKSEFSFHIVILLDQDMESKSPHLMVVVLGQFFLILRIR